MKIAVAVVLMFLVEALFLAVLYDVLAYASGHQSTALGDALAFVGDHPYSSSVVYSLAAALAGSLGLLAAVFVWGRRPKKHKATVSEYDWGLR